MRTGVRALAVGSAFARIAAVALLAGAPWPRIAAVGLLAGAAWAQGKDTGAQYDKKEYELSIQQSQRHLEYGLELRKQGMTAQSAEQIILAAELGKGRNPGATQVLFIMRQADELFWKKHGSRPTPGKVESYTKKARGLLESDQKETLDLANWASTHKCEHQAERIYLKLLKDRDEALEFDAKGQIVLPAGTIDKAASAKLREGAVAINGRWYVRDALLSELPELKHLFEVSSPDLRVRTTTTAEEAAELHAMCTQLLPALSADVGASPQRRLTLFLFATREEYGKALDALGMGAQKITSGFASRDPLVAMVCAEGQSVEVARGVCLHETTHLFCYAVSQSVFPSWYWEGFADTYGGTETFTWDGSKLELGGLMARSRIDALKEEGGLMPIATLLSTDQLSQWQKGEQFGLAFYAQAWAFVRYLRSEAGAEIAARLEQWEARCVGQVLGFELGAARSTNSGPASDLFMELFGKDLPKLEAGFKEWLREL